MRGHASWDSVKDATAVALFTRLNRETYMLLPRHQAAACTTNEDVCSDNAPNDRIQ